MDNLKELASRFEKFVGLGYGDYLFLNLDRPLDTFRAQVEKDGDEVLVVHVRDGVVRKVNYVDEDDNLKRQDKFGNDGVLESVHQKKRGDEKGLQVDRANNSEWKLESRSKSLSNFKHLLLGPELGEVSEAVNAIVTFVDEELFQGLEKEKVYFEMDDKQVVIKVGKGRKGTIHRF